MAKRILIIEDDRDILSSIETLLDLYDFDVVGVTDTTDIISLINQHQPDLVLTDFVLPGMNGGQICKAIKHHKKWSYIPVILMTAYHKQAIAVANFGYDAYLSKPFENKKLIDIVENLLS